MPWRPLARFRDREVAKLFNLRRAARAGLRVPPTWWLPAAAVQPASLAPPAGLDAPWILRSASPTEDTDASTAAGQFVSRVVESQDLAAFRAAARAVVASLPRDGAGRARGALFVQPLLRPARGGVAFFDGFYFERTSAPGGNLELTAGRARGEVERGALRRDEPWSDWLRRLARVFARELAAGAALDLELAEEPGGAFTLLQARPARFALRRDPVLSLANHREILGDPPSPWIVAALERAGADALGFFAEVDPAVRRWDERYAVAVGGRAWLNFSFFHRLMDHWGLPRSFVAEGVGGADDGPADARVDLARMARKSPRLIALQLKNGWTVARAGRALAALDRRIASARDLPALFDATAAGLGVALRTNFAINGALTGLVRVRRALGIRGRARVTTEEMMEGYDALRRLDEARLDAALDAWLARFGHRGPLESDPARPRFAELRTLLRADLARGAAPAAASAPARPARGPLFALDRRRESFRDELMRSWTELRARILAAARRELDAGRLARVEDVFLLTGDDLRALPAREELAARRARQEQLAGLDLPTTAPRSRIEARLARQLAEEDEPAGDCFRGIALGQAVFEGRVRKADDLVALLEAEHEDGRAALDADTVLVVPALEPSWAVVFGRVGAVVTELGGELSHASILLREARKPAIVNCPGVWRGLADGERVRLDGASGVVRRLGV